MSYLVNLNIVCSVVMTLMLIILIGLPASTTKTENSDDSVATTHGGEDAGM